MSEYKYRAGYTPMTDEDRRSLDKEKGPDELYGDDCPGERGNTRAPKFGEWMRGVWASEINPHRDGMFVRTVRRTGHVNNGTWHELTDGKGNFWQYEANSTVFLTPNAAVKPRSEAASARTHC